MTAAKGSQKGGTFAGSMEPGAIAAYNMGSPFGASDSRRLGGTSSGRDGRSSNRGRGRGDARQICFGPQFERDEDEPNGAFTFSGSQRFARHYYIWSPVGPVPAATGRNATPRGTPACGLGLTGKSSVGNVWPAGRRSMAGFRRANINITHCTRYNGEAYSHIYRPER